MRRPLGTIRDACAFECVGRAWRSCAHRATRRVERCRADASAVVAILRAARS
ncbi:MULTISPECIES: hypothetical protein [Burkholderia]|uniref:hypothetical protein n=1 Tax=Burkholderia TaxID=32008 RepID=UPI00158B29F2|nr:MULTISPECIES: hypothetical protein [Burkholderia]MCU9956672.1 hypothetical protein [Burkholderia sp. BKH01]